MNTYKKYCPNVFVAQCEEQQEKGNTIILTTKYGKEHECEVHNFLGHTGTQEDKKYLYSITRCDGFNSQERAKAKAEKLQGYAGNAEKRSSEAYKKSDMSEDATGIPFGQPILVGHHSERKHRKLIERSWANMDKSLAESKKAEEYKRRSEYWQGKSNEINLSMPESLEYYEFKLLQKTKTHKFLKENPEQRPHSMALSYASKAVKEAKKNVEIAVKLWGTPEEIAQIENEKIEQARAKTSKKKLNIIDKYNGFFAFNNEQLKKGHSKLIEIGRIEKGEKVVHIRHGLYIAHKDLDQFLKEL